MAIITVTEAKNILNITEATYDNQIARLIPYVQDDICEYLDNYFQDRYVARESVSYISFVRSTTGSGDYIFDSDDRWTKNGFLSDIDVVVEGGYSNVGIHHVVTATTDTLTLDSSGELIGQNPADSSNENLIGNVKVSRVIWPKGLKRYVAQMIWYNIQRQKETGVVSESIDDYSVTYASLSGGGYPENITAGLRPYRRAVVI